MNRKHILKIFLLAIGIGLVSLFSACSFTTSKGSVAVPDFSINEDKVVLIDSNMDNVSSFTVRVDGADSDTYNSYLDISHLITEAKTYEICVRANGKDGYKNSAFSEVKLFTNSTTLSSPTLKITDKTVWWQKDFAVDSYTVTMTRPDGNVERFYTASNRYNFSSDLKQAGRYSFSVVANSTATNVTSSEPSDSVSYAHIVKHVTPTELSIQEVENDVVLTFKDVDNANSYTININGHTLQANDSSVKLNLLEYDFSTPQRYYVSVKSNGSDYYTESKYSGQAYYDKYVRLDTPTLNEIRDNVDDLLLSWSKVNNAHTYDVYVRGEIYASSVNATQIVVPKSQLDASGQIDYQVQAVGYDHYTSSFLSNRQNYQEVVVYDTPSALQVMNVGNQLVFSWKSVDTDCKYLVEIDGVNYTADTNEFVLDPYFTEAKSYTLRVMAIPNETSTKSPSNYSGALVYTHLVTLGKVDGVRVEDVLTDGGLRQNLLYFNDEIAHAVSYKIYVNGSLAKIDVVTSPVDVTSLLSQPDSYNFAVQAIAPTLSLYRDGEKSNEFLFEYRKTLDTPANIKLDESGAKPILRWSAVANADSYEVYINNLRFTTANNYLDISRDYVVANEYTFKVRALPAENSYYTESAYVVTTVIKYVQLEMPKNVSVEFKDDGSVIVNFTPVENAHGYEIAVYDSANNRIDKDNPNTNTNITDLLKKAGRYKVTVQAIGWGYYRSSVVTKEVYFEKDITLTAPKNISVAKQKDSETMYLNFDAVENSSKYNIKINEEVFSATTNKVDITKYITLEGKYNIKIQSVGIGAYTDSEYTTYTYKHEFANLYDYKRCDVFMNGEMIDMYIDTYQEFKLAVWYNYLYRNTVAMPNGTLKQGFKLYFPNGYTQLVAGVKSEYDPDFEIQSRNVDTYADLYGVMFSNYPEYYSLTNIQLEEKSANRIYLCTYVDRMNENHGEEFTYTAEVEKNPKLYNQEGINAYLAKRRNVVNNPNQPVNYIDDNARTRADDYDGFEINDDNKTVVPVTNTDQLFMAVQYGARPKFVGNCEVAQTVYENAKYILRRIINNDFTDYQKIEAIYDWLTRVNVYDYDVVAFTEVFYYDGGDVDTIGQYSPFHLEGVFYNWTDGNIHAKAVCDGISKAFVLLCQIEGIDCYKCNGAGGKQGNEANWGAHAWNKVYLIDKWYVVDSTWDDQMRRVNGSYQVNALHQYFLKSDEYIAKTHREDYPLRAKSNANYKCNENYDYFAGKTYSYNGKTIDLVVKDEYELAELLKFAYSSNFVGNVLEFRMSDKYLADPNHNQDYYNYMLNQAVNIAQVSYRESTDYNFIEDDGFRFGILTDKSA